MIIKRVSTVVLGSAAAFAMVASPSLAAVAVTDGVGFVGKGDVQLAFGWNNTQLQKNAGGVTFTEQGKDFYDVTCEWETVTGGPKSRVIEHDITLNKHTGINANISYEARTKNQINGFTLNGYGTMVTTGSVPAVGDSCPMAHQTAEVTAVQLTRSEGGLFVNHGTTSVALPNTPVA